MAQCPDKDLPEIGGYLIDMLTDPMAEWPKPALIMRLKTRWIVQCPERFVVYYCRKPGEPPRAFMPLLGLTAN